MFRCCRSEVDELDDLRVSRMPSLENIPMPHHDMYRFRQIDRILKQLRDQPCDLDAFENALDQLNVPGESIAGVLRFFGEEIDPDEADSFFQHTLPFIATLACDLPNLMTQPVPYLRSQASRSVSLSRVQVASLLANAFFCVMPGPISQVQCNELNLTRLYAALAGGGSSSANVCAKMRCMIVYFESLRLRMPQGHIVIHRRCVDSIPWDHWRASTAPLRDVDIREEGIIEDAGTGALQCDFANKFIGGGVLSRGCVQEEIMFIVAPELVVSILVSEVLHDNEVIFLSGADQFAAYEGYGSDFRCTGAYRGRAMAQRTIVAMDALMFQRGFLGEQLDDEVMLRELNKARAAFIPAPHENPIPISTGNWGCGAFGGDPELKAIIQIMAASLTKRTLLYYTFGDERVAWLETTLRMLKEYNFNVGMLAELLTRLAAEYERGNVSEDTSVFEWISDNMGDVEQLRRVASTSSISKKSSSGRKKK